MIKKTMKKTFTLPPKKDTLNPPSKLMPLELKSDSECADGSLGDAKKVKLADDMNARLTKNRIARDEAKKVATKKTPTRVKVSY